MRRKIPSILKKYLIELAVKLKPETTEPWGQKRHTSLINHNVELMSIVHTGEHKKNAKLKIPQEGIHNELVM